MKNEISPIWEDPENRNGSICSIKIDSIEEAYDILKMLTYHMVNNTLLKFSPNMWNVINGISHGPKRLISTGMNSWCVIIKIWLKPNMTNHTQIEKIFNEEVAQHISKYSVKAKAIKPEY